MKGLPGLMIAAGLGVVGAVCNWFYVSKQARDYEKVAFVTIRSDAQINVGDRFKSDHFDKVDIPKKNVGNLDQVAVTWNDAATAIGVPAARSFRGGELLLRQDLTTPAQRDLSQLLGPNEVLRWVPVDPRSFVPEHVNPGDQVSFIVPVLPGGQPTPAGNSQNLAAAPTQIVGPFEILALGTRKGRREILRAAGESSGQENLVGVRVQIVNGALEAKAVQLFAVLQQTGNKGVGVMLHSARKKE
jgi:hypothetical protein